MQIQGMSISEFIDRVKIGMIKPESAIEDVLNCLEMTQDYDDIAEEIVNLKEERETLQAEKEEFESCVMNCSVILDKPDSEQTDTQALTAIAKLIYEAEATKKPAGFGR